MKFLSSKEINSEDEAFLAKLEKKQRKIDPKEQTLSPVM
jgi:hypothetical protein